MKEEIFLNEEKQDKKFFENIIYFIPNVFFEIINKIKKIFKAFSHQKEEESKNDFYLSRENKENQSYYKNLNENQYNDDIYYNNYNSIQTLTQTQTQTQASKQRLMQLESQTYSNSTMANMISTAELYALSANCQNEQLYKKFDKFDNLKRKTKKDLKGELILQIECFKISFLSYVKKYKKYDYPDDYDEEKTLEELKMIKNKINKEDKKFYEAIINLLKGNTKIPSFDKELDELEEDDNDSGKKDPRLQIKTDIPIIRHLNGIKKNLKKNYLNDPMNYRVRLNLEQPKEKNEELQQLARDLDEMNREEKLFKSKRLYRSRSTKSILNYEYKIEEEKNKKNFNRNKSIEKLTIKIKKELELYFNDNKSKNLSHLNHSNNLSCHCDDCDIFSDEDLK